MQIRASLVLQASVLCLLGVMNSASMALDFAVQNRVTRGSQVRNETRTIITDEAFYDVMFEGNNPSEVSVYVPKRHQYHLLLFQTKRNATIDDTDVRTFKIRVVEHAKKHKDPLVRFAADPEFAVTLEENDLRLKSKLWTYNVSIDKQRPDYVDAYRDFADAFARLNMFWSFPPQARIELNKEIHRAAGLPTKVEVRLKGKKGRPDIVQVSHHEYSWNLTDSDRKLIDAAKKAIVEFKAVKISEVQQQKIPHAKAD